MKMPPARGGPIRPSDRWQPVPDAAQPKTQGPAPAQATAPAAAAAAAVAVPSKPAGQPASGRSAGSAKQETSKRVHTSEGAQADGAVDGAARSVAAFRLCFAAQCIYFCLSCMSCSIAAIAAHIVQVTRRGSPFLGVQSGLCERCCDLCRSLPTLAWSVGKLI